MKNLRDGNRGREGGTSHPIAMRRKEGERAVIYERDRGRPRDTRRRTTQSGAHATWGQNQRRRGTGDTLQLRDLTRGRKEMAIGPAECEQRRRRPRLLASYKNCLSCPPSCLLTHSDPKEGRKGRGGSHSEGRRKALCCGVCGIIACSERRNDPLQKETATQWGRRRGGEIPKGADKQGKEPYE